MIPDKVALVTGGSQGIGLAIMHALLREGAFVVAVSRDANNLKQALNAVDPQYQDHVTAIQADVRNEFEVHHAVQQVVSTYGRIDILINSAGISMREKQNLQDTDITEWNRMIDINLTGTYLMCREVLPFMKAQDMGYVINILSTASFRSGSGNGLYVASKYGARALTETIMEENRRTGVRVTSVSPGAVDSTIWNHKIEQITQEERSTMLKTDDIASIVVYLVNLPPRVHIDNITVTPWYR
ncbi:SDR family oxidoreductase [Paenibacillus sp. 1_12]|uniref:SDR family oxidoreductase n=1 Tax=Paenibacillus sp. 1_12 TaxID=1566278 RepID=UPI0015A53131|nr:SDR family oxidoreductase [Paenibacillus sp. 1_12]